MQANVESFHHPSTGTWSHVLSDPASAQAVVIDPVLDYNAAAARTSLDAARRILEYVQQKRLDVAWVLETHAHADHLSAAQFFARELGARVGIGRGITAVQQHFAAVYNLGSDFAADGSQFDRLFDDGDTLMPDSLNGQVMSTPGHTSDSVAYLFDGMAFIGDTMFMPASGTARCDFPGGDARALYASIKRLLALPPDTRLYLCHDYPDGRDAQAWVTVAEQRAANRHVRDGVDVEAFVAMRSKRDATLAAPALILPSVQVNIRAGRLPEPDDNGIAYLRIPLDAL